MDRKSEELEAQAPVWAFLLVTSEVHCGTENRNKTIHLLNRSRSIRQMKFFNIALYLILSGISPIKLPSLVGI